MDQGWSWWSPKSSVLLLVTSLLMLPAGLKAIDRNARECQMWANLENKTLPLQNQGHLNCTTNDHCTGFDCVGMYQDKALSFGMRVLPCQDPPGVEVFGSAPQFNTENFSHVFTHRSQYDLPGHLLNLSMLPQSIMDANTDDLHGKFEVHIKRNPERKSLVMGLIVRGCIDKTCISKQNIFSDAEIPVPECTNHVDHGIKTDSVCSMKQLNNCGSNQVCVQQHENNPEGLCECMMGFSKHRDGTCVSPVIDDQIHPEISNRVPKSANPVPHVDVNAVKSVADSSESTGGGSTTLAVVLSVLAAVVLMGVAAFLVFRTRMAPRLRARLTSTPYEDIVIGRRSESTQNVVEA
ncbi:hypothetical protein TCAL_15087 [Tigriopus californicus]|uniref:EGF-like domain-containing protein n=1 Tax=Tigriopus californicus TaxID=6832 RepID=A0A553NT70_TIGCA|nr:uncharacterized protein LOC131878705 [Tigriopus californicus]TRY68627.1 hypothetical protein TCAL_15087 [Tigriopus californicus]